MIPHPIFSTRDHLLNPGVINTTWGVFFVGKDAIRFGDLYKLKM